MASRPVYIPLESGKLLVKTEYVDFDWSPGMSLIQKQKSVRSLHKSIIRKNITTKILEVSSKSEKKLGVCLSAFNLQSECEQNGNFYTVESLFQSSKVFANGGPYIDLLHLSSLSAKKDRRLKDSGELLGFRLFGVDWPLEPKTVFYDWVYISALIKNTSLIIQLEKYNAFTDIEFNPKNSINCQAYSVALYMSLNKRNLLSEVMVNKETFLDFFEKKDSVMKLNEQGSLF